MYFDHIQYIYNCSYDVERIFVCEDNGFYSHIHTHYYIKNTILKRLIPRYHRRKIHCK